MADPIVFAYAGETEIALLPKMANRHGLIAGATGTGKTVTLQKLAEQFSKMGVPVFMADIKGDLTGISQPGSPKPKVMERLEVLGMERNEWFGCPVVLWDVFGEQGHPLRTTISEMGPLLFSRLLQLTDIQGGVLTLAFKFADDHGLLLLDLKDLRALLQFVSEHAKEFKAEYGNVTPASVGAIQRGLLTLEQQGGNVFFGEPALDIADLMRKDPSGKGFVNIVAADKLFANPLLYSTFLLWMMTELYEHMPEAGDLEKPKLVFFFDEAHLLFNDAPDALVDKVEQVVRLIRSKGVGVYFCTQNPIDVPEKVLGQLGNRVQHALRAFTPRDQKAVRSAAETFRANPKIDVEEAITQMGVGEALASMLDDKGTPTIVERCLVAPPQSQIGPITDEQRAKLKQTSPVAGKYDQAIDRESAYEVLKGRKAPDATPADHKDDEAAAKAAAFRKEQGMAEANADGSHHWSVGGVVSGAAGGLWKLFKSSMTAARSSLGGYIGRKIVRGAFGNILSNRK